MSTPTDRGRFVWYDLMTPDPAAAPDFYTKIADWGTQPWDSGDPKLPPYTMWTAGHVPIGGMMKLPPQLAERGVPPHWIAYVYVPDVDETAKQVKSLGGTLHHEPMGIPNVGRFVTFVDPQGATLAAFTPANDPPRHEGPTRIGEFSWHELVTSDHVAAFNFYSALFGWERTSEMDMGEYGVYQMYGHNGVPLGGMFNTPPDRPIPPSWMFYIYVENADKAAELVTKHGGKILNGPMDIPGGGRIAQCMDPQGAAFAVHSETSKGA